MTTRCRSFSTRAAGKDRSSASNRDSGSRLLSPVTSHTTSRALERRVRQRHPAVALVLPGDGNEAVAYVEHGIARDQRRRARPHRGRGERGLAAPKLRRVPVGRGFDVGFVDRQRADCVVGQRSEKLPEVPVVRPAARSVRRPGNTLTRAAGRSSSPTRAASSAPRLSASVNAPRSSIATRARSAIRRVTQRAAAAASSATSTFRVLTVTRASLRAHRTRRATPREADARSRLPLSR